MDAFIATDAESDTTVVAEIIDKMPTMFQTDHKDELLLEACGEISVIPAMLQKEFDSRYKLSGSIYYSGRLTLEDKYKYILRNYYPDGIKLYTEQETGRFRSYIETLFGDVRIPENNRAIDGRIAAISVLCDKGRYIHPSYIVVDQSLLERIFNYIRKSDKMSFSFAELFGIFEDDLRQSSNISNQFFLQGVLGHYCRESLFFRKDTVSKERIGGSTYEIPTVSQSHIEDFVTGNDKQREIFYHSLVERIRMIVLERYKNGFRLESAIELARLRSFLSSDLVGDVSLSDDELESLISVSGVLFEGKIYIVSEHTKDEIMKMAEDYLESGARIIFYEEFYSKNEFWLFNECIVSMEMLNGIFRLLMPSLTFTQTYFGYMDLSVNSAIESEALRVWGDDILLNYEQVAERLPYIPRERIRNALGQNNDFLWNSAETFTHMSKFDITVYECALIRETAQRECGLHRYISLTDLPLSDVVLRNHDLSMTAIHTAVFKACLSENFERRGKIITPKGAKIDVYSLLMEFCLSRDRCTLEDMYEFEKDLTGEICRTLTLQAGYNIMVRIDENTFIANKHLNFDNAETDRAIDFFLKDEYIPLRAINTFAIFPNCGQPWNLFLLESYVRRFSDVFRFETTSITNNSIGCIVRRSSKLTYDGILADAVARSNIMLSEDAIADYLYVNGYRSRRLKSNLTGLISRAKSIREGRG